MGRNEEHIINFFWSYMIFQRQYFYDACEIVHNMYVILIVFGVYFLIILSFQTL